MARAQRVVITDDLTGEEIEEGDLHVTTFSVQGVEYRLDLSGESTELFDSEIEPWINRAVRVGGRKSAAPRQISKEVATNTSATVTSSRAKPGVNRRHSASELQEIRVWAKQNGHEISDRGRIPVEVQEAWEAAASSAA